MYAFISGRVVSANDGKIILENNGIGYELKVSNNTIIKSGIVGKNLTLYTYMQVKDDNISLYGFSDIEEKELFLKLITISGIGPKMALQVLSGMEFNSLILAIVTGDSKSLTKIKGLGKKTAERIILELKGKIQSEQLDSINDFSTENDSVINDAVQALVSLGVDKSNAYKAVVSASEKCDKLEDIITTALRSFDFRG